MLNKIIISALLLMCAVLNAQVLPVETDEKVKITNVEFGSGVKYDFEAIEADENNQRLAELFEKAHNQYKQNRFSEALRNLVKFIETPISDKGIYVKELKWRKHDAYGLAAGLLVKKKDYQKGLEYAEMFQNVYPDYSTCGHGAFASYFWCMGIKSDCLIGLGQNDSAIALLEEYLFTPDFYEDHRPSIGKLVMLLSEKYGVSYLKSGLEHVKINYSMYGISVNFLGKEYRIGSTLMVRLYKLYRGKNITEEEYRTQIQDAFKQHYTYKLIMGKN